MFLFSNISKLIVIFISLTILNAGQAYQVGNNPRRRAEILDPEGRYLLEWEVDPAYERITFNVTVATRGWIGLGFSNDDTSSGADMVVGGVGPNGRGYLSDRHMLGESDIAVLDSQQDYALLSALETRTHTSLSFSRALDTCESEDYAITLNQLNLRWAYGRNENDNEIGFNPENSGTLGIHLLDPDYSPEIRRDRSGSPTLITSNRNENIPKDTKIWSVPISRTLPSNDTVYLCSIYKAPRLKRKHHFIGYDIHFLNDESRQRAHHMLMYRCHAPQGMSERQIFEPHLNHPGETCYQFRTPGGPGSMPLHMCSELYIGWAVGGRTFFMPDHVGAKFGESEDEYYMLQVHYDNPQMQRVPVDLRFDFFYTSQLRPNEGGMMTVNHEVPGVPESLLIPPNSQHHRLFGHCSSECTRRMYPPGGIKISAIILHAHSSAVGMRLHHFRGERELPWVLYDDNYNSQVQPVRHLRREATILPGDQLTIDCHFQNNGTTTVGGFSSRQEMCMAFLVHYERVQEYSSCASEIYSIAARQEFLGIQNITWVQADLEWVVQTPAYLAGLTVSQVSDRFINWTPDRRRKLERFHETHPHSGGCHKDTYTRNLVQSATNPTASPILSSLVLNTQSDYRAPVSYPFKATPDRPPGKSCPNGRR